MYTILHYCLYGEGSIRSIKHHKTLKIIKQQMVFEVVPMRRTPSSSPLTIKDRMWASVGVLCMKQRE